MAVLPEVGPFGVYLPDYQEHGKQIEFSEELPPENQNQNKIINQEKIGPFQLFLLN